MTFAWDYPSDQTNLVAFDFEGSTNLYQWYLLGTTSNLFFTNIITKPFEFYRVGAHFR